MSFLAQWHRRVKVTGSVSCLGLDPVFERIPVKKDSVQETIEQFLVGVLESAESANALPSAVKPNIAFFAQYGFDGLHALARVIAVAHEMNLVVVLDAKRGDIGATSEAYAREVFEVWKADGVTVAPYMGFDSVSPFLEAAQKTGKCVFVLCRTSNPGARDIQNLKLAGGSFLFNEMAKKIVQWGANSDGNLGAVVGATSKSELAELAQFFGSQKTPFPFLIPGVGAQGAKASDVLQTLSNAAFPVSNALINSGSAILYAHEKNKQVSSGRAVLQALQSHILETKIEFWEKTQLF